MPLPRTEGGKGENNMAQENIQNSYRHESITDSIKHHSHKNVCFKLTKMIKISFPVDRFLSIHLGATQKTNVKKGRKRVDYHKRKLKWK